MPRRTNLPFEATSIRWRPGWLRLRVTPSQEHPTQQERPGGPRSEHAEASPRADGQAAEVDGGLDRKPRGHRPDLLKMSLPERVSDNAGDDREEVEESEHDPDGRRGVPHGGSDAQAEQRDQSEVENRAR